MYRVQSDKDGKLISDEYVLDIFLYQYRSYIEVVPNLAGALREWVMVRGEYNPANIYERVTDYIVRNGHPIITREEESMKQYKVFIEYNDGFKPKPKEFDSIKDAKSYFSNIDERDINTAYLIEYPTGYNGATSEEIARKEGKARK